jgi:hypothetical protein
MKNATSGSHESEQTLSLSEARHGAAHGLGQVHFGAPFDALLADGQALCGAAKAAGDDGVRLEARIALLGPCIALLGEIEEDDQPAEVSELLFAWADDVVNGGGYRDDLLATRGRVEAEITWALAFVDMNFDLITELSSEMISAYPDAVGCEACTALVGARIVEPDATALEVAGVRLAGSLVLLQRIDEEVLARL